tara:strand:- start:48 stop:818 length:771 start_codon:yes stop_codon:yes gene_type:complete
MITNDYKKVPEKSKYECECGKQYKYRQGLYNHKKTCNFKKENLENLKEDNLENAKKIENDDNVDYKELFLKAMEKNDELVSKIVEMAPNIGNNNNNNINNKFNINVFLNDKCKDALNLMDFVDSLKLQLQDLETTGRLGYAEGVSQIFRNGLSNIELTKRPIHCIEDDKNIYVKENNIWDKDQEDKSSIKRAIEHVGKNNFKQIQDWIDENPECTDTGTYKNTEYMKIVENSITKNENDVEKIIENIKNEVIIKND